jgi:hypothetical protein
MEARKQVCNLLEAANAIIPLLGDGTPLSDAERILIESAIGRLRSAFLLWDCIQRESRFLQMPTSKQLPRTPPA